MRWKCHHDDKVDISVWCENPSFSSQQFKKALRGLPTLRLDRPCPRCEYQLKQEEEETKRRRAVEERWIAMQNFFPRPRPLWWR